MTAWRYFPTIPLTKTSKWLSGALLYRSEPPLINTSQPLSLCYNMSFSWCTHKPILLALRSPALHSYESLAPDRESNNAAVSLVFRTDVTILRHIDGMGSQETLHGPVHPSATSHRDLSHTHRVYFLVLLTPTKIYAIDCCDLWSLQNIFKPRIFLFFMHQKRVRVKDILVGIDRRFGIFDLTSIKKDLYIFETLSVYLSKLNINRIGEYFWWSSPF